LFFFHGSDPRLSPARDAKRRAVDRPCRVAASPGAGAFQRKQREQPLPSIANATRNRASPHPFFSVFCAFPRTASQDFIIFLSILAYKIKLCLIVPCPLCYTEKNQVPAWPGPLSRNRGDFSPF